MRVCAQPGCPTLTDTSRCATHTREREQARGTRQQRGYGAEHEAIRAALLPLAYGTKCPIDGPHCVGYMYPHQDLQLDHSTPLVLDSTSKGDRIVCAPCNLGRHGANTT
jgi:hypothetical protein